jgi:squalene synthase HpnD
MVALPYGKGRCAMSLPQHSGTNSASIASGSSFYAAMRILPPAQRQAMFAVYAFCRAVDDIADDDGPAEKRLARLERWREDIERVYAGAGETELTEGLEPLIAAFGFAKADFLAVIDGMEMDVTGVTRAPDWAMLDLYCDRVASAVGRLCVRIFGLADEDGLPLSHHLGRALQMTNILRDLDEDAAMGRLYLPREALAAAGIASQEPFEVLSHPALNDACRVLAARARSHFDAAEAVMARCERGSVRSPRLMAAVYRAMLDRLVSRGWSPPRHKLRHSVPMVIWAVFRHGLL